jgi:acetyl-CoA hydrolase/transferase-like protein
VELLPVDLVNDPRRIGEEPNFISINATTEVDLYGQCASENRRRPILVFERRPGRLRPRSFVLARRPRVHRPPFDDEVGSQQDPDAADGGLGGDHLKNTVEHVVTEYGIAELRGRSLSERAAALIAVAHPDHRDELEREAQAAGLLRSQRPRSSRAPAGRQVNASAPAG